jgi:F420H(2)-dependent quinone reductase
MRQNTGPPGANDGMEVLSSDMPLDGEYELSPEGWVRDQTEKILETGTTTAVQIMDRPVILLTTRGAKSGKLRKVPLMRVEHDGTYAIVASLGGAPKHPVWYHNVKANPQVELQDDTVTKDYTAREVTGDEKAQWWERAVAAYPEYENYQKKTDRQIPVFVLEPVEA